MRKKLCGLLVVALSMMAGSAFAASIADTWEAGGTVTVTDGDKLERDVKLTKSTTIAIGNNVAASAEANVNVEMNGPNVKIAIAANADDSSLTLTRAPGGNGGNFTLTSGADDAVAISAAGIGNALMDVGGDFTQKANKVAVAAGDDGGATLKVGGNYTLSGATSQLILQSSAAGAAILHVESDFTQEDGAVTAVAGDTTGATGDNTAIVSIDGNYQINAGTFALGSAGGQTANFNVGKDFIMNSGEFALAAGGAGDVEGVVQQDFTMKSGQFMLGGTAAGDATMTVGGKAVLTGGALILQKETGATTFKALTYDISKAAVAIDNGAVFEATSSDETTDGVAFTVHNGGTIMAAGDNFADASAGIIKGADGQKFVLTQGGVLSTLGGDLQFSGFDNKGTIALDGILNFGAKDGGNLTDAEVGSLIFGATNTAVTVGPNTRIILDSALKQSITSNRATFDKVLLIKGENLAGAVAGVDYTGYLGSEGSKKLLTALGAYTVQQGDKLDIPGNADNLYISKIENVVDFAKATGNDADNRKAFASNTSAMYGSHYANSGLMRNVFGVAIDGSGLADGDLIDGYSALRITPITLPGGGESPVGSFNYNVLEAMADGYGTPFDVIDDDDNLGTLDQGTVETFAGVTLGKISDIAQGAAMQNISGIFSHNSQTRAQMAALGVDSSDALASAMLNANVANRIWAGGLGMWEDADTREGFAGYKYDSYGVQVGYDHYFGPVTVGAAFGYQTGDYKDKAWQSNDSTIDHYSFNLYATYNHTSGFYATVLGGYTYSDNDMNYTTGGVSYKQDYHSNSWYAEGKVGYDIRAGAFTLTPSVGLGYIRTNSKAHDLHAAGVGAPIRYGKQKSDTGYLPIALEAKYDVCTGNGNIFSISANGGYTYNFNDDPVHGTMLLNGLTNSNAYSVIGRSRGHNMWNAGAGLKYSAERWEVGAKYDYFAKEDADAHRVFGYVGIKF